MGAGSAGEKLAARGGGEGASSPGAGGVGGVGPLKGRGLGREPPPRGGAGPPRGGAGPPRDTRRVRGQPPRLARLCLLSAGSTGAASTFSRGCACGGGSGGEGAAIPRTLPGHGRGSVSEHRSGRGASGRPRPASRPCRVAPQLGTPPGAEAGASAGPDELSVERPGPCPPALGACPPPPHTRRHCPASQCIKGLNRSHRASLLTAAAAATLTLGAPLHAGCVLSWQGLSSQ